MRGRRHPAGRGRSALAAALLTTLAAAAQDTPSDESAAWSQLLRRARELVDAERPAEAAALLAADWRERVVREPRSLSVHYACQRLAELAAARGDERSRALWLARAAEAHPGTSGCVAAVPRALERGDWTGVLRALESHCTARWLVAPCGRFFDETSVDRALLAAAARRRLGLFEEEHAGLARWVLEGGPDAFAVTEAFVEAHRLDGRVDELRAELESTFTDATEHARAWLAVREATAAGDRATLWAALTDRVGYEVEERDVRVAEAALAALVAQPASVDDALATLAARDERWSLAVLAAAGRDEALEPIVRRMEKALARDRRWRAESWAGLLAVHGGPSARAELERRASAGDDLADTARRLLGALEEGRLPLRARWVLEGPFAEEREGAREHASPHVKTYLDAVAEVGR